MQDFEQSCRGHARNMKEVVDSLKDAKQLVKRTDESRRIAADTMLWLMHVVVVLGAALLFQGGVYLFVHMCVCVCVFFGCVCLQEYFVSRGYVFVCTRMCVCACVFLGVRRLHVCACVSHKMHIYVHPRA